MNNKMQPNTLVTISFASKQGHETINCIVASIVECSSYNSSSTPTPTTSTTVRSKYFCNHPIQGSRPAISICLID